MKERLLLNAKETDERAGNPPTRSLFFVGFVKKFTNVKDSSGNCEV